MYNWIYEFILSQKRKHKDLRIHLSLQCTTPDTQRKKKLNLTSISYLYRISGSNSFCFLFFFHSSFDTSSCWSLFSLSLSHHFFQIPQTIHIKINATWIKKNKTSTTLVSPWRWSSLWLSFCSSSSSSPNANPSKLVSLQETNRETRVTKTSKLSRPTARPKAKN